MKTFGPYQVIQEISNQRGTVVYKGRDNTTEVVIKVYHLAHFADGDPRRVEELSQSFYRTVEMQKTMAEKSEYIMPVLVYGMQGEAAWEVSPVYPSSAQKLIASKTVPPREQFQKIIDSVLQGAMDLKDQHGRSHGNLKPSNILITTDPKTRVTNVVLRDALPGDGAQSEKFEVADLNAIGRLMYLLVLPAENRDPSVWNVSETQPPSSWTQLFGNQAKAWATICNRLLDPNLAPHSYSLERLALDLLKIKPADAKAKSGAPSKSMPALVAAVVVLAAAGGFFAWKASQKKAPAPTVVKVVPDTEALRAKEETARKATEEATRLAEEKRLAEERAAAQAKVSEEARLKAEAEAARLAEEKKLLEARALKAREEARLQTEAVAYAQREAAEKEAELARLRKERQNAEQVQARQQRESEEATRELKRKLDEAQSRELAAELAKGKKLGEVQRTVSTTRTEPEPVQASRQPRKYQGWLNSVGMRFAPVPEERILVSIWETRRKDFEEFISSSRRTVDSNWKKTSFEQGSLHPVVNITVAEAEAFCEWLTQSERSKGLLAKGQFYRLPTEREWIGVATDLSRGSGYMWGNVWPPPSGIGNYGPTYSYDRFDFTAAAGQFRATASGIYDVAGNVWEMCLSGASSWTARGGSWLTTSPDELTLSHTVPLRATDRREDIGFRCVLDLGN
jgi:hypothetical protein